MTRSQGPLRLMCSGRRALTEAMTEFVFTPLGDRPVEFAAGQFLTFAFDIDGRRIERCYSITSAASRRDELTIAVKHGGNGYVSTWLHENLIPGTCVHAFGPLGRFTLPQTPTSGLLLVSAGSGITPIMSMLRSLTDASAAGSTAHRPADVVVLHVARTAAEVAFRDELEQLTRLHPNLRLTLAYSGATTAAPGGGEPQDRRTEERSGRVDATLLGDICGDLATREVFLCGPGGFRAHVRTHLLAAGVPLARIHEESFGFAMPQPATCGLRVDFSRRARHVTVAPGSTILAAAAAAGVTVPSSCGIGVCGSCKVSKVSGEVVMNHQGGIAAREIAAGKILLCCSEPLTPVVIDF